MAGRSDLPRLCVYCSEHAHSSVDKAVILLGLGHDSLRRSATDDEVRMRPDALAAAIDRDKAASMGLTMQQVGGDVAARQ